MLISRAAHSMVSGCLFRPGRRPLCAVVTFWSIVWVPCVRPGPVWRRTNMPITPAGRIHTTHSAHCTLHFPLMQRFWCALSTECTESSEHLVCTCTECSSFCSTLSTECTDVL